MTIPSPSSVSRKLGSYVSNGAVSVHSTRTIMKMVKSSMISGLPKGDDGATQIVFHRDAPMATWLDRVKKMYPDNEVWMHETEYPYVTNGKKDTRMVPAIWIDLKGYGPKYLVNPRKRL